MFRKILSVLLAALMAVSFAACGGKKRAKRDVTVPVGKKVGIILTSQTQYPEDSIAANNLAKKYENSIVIKQCGDSRVLTPGTPEIVTAAAELATDENIGALIFDRATQFTDKAIAAAKAVNPDILTFAIEPEREGNEVSSSVTVEFVADWEKFAVDIVSTAKEQGAEYFVTFTFPAHTENSVYANLDYHLERNCEANEIEYIRAESRDPIYSGGIAEAKKSVDTALETLYEDGSVKGENVVLFSTDSSVQSELVKLTGEKGLIYIMPSFPTAFNGISDCFGIELPASTGDAQSYIDSVKDAAKGLNGRFCVYTETFATTLLTAAVYTAFDMLGNPEYLENSDSYLKNAADRVYDATDNSLFESRTLDGYFNAVLCYCPALEIIEHEDVTEQENPETDSVTQEQATE